MDKKEGKEGRKTRDGKKEVDRRGGPLQIETDRISNTATISAPKLLKMSFSPVSVLAMRVSAKLRLRPKLGTGIGRRPNVYNDL